MKHIPIPGQRIVRSVLAALMCIAIYYLRGRRGAPFYSIIAALQCIQPYTENMLTVGKNRITGTLIGAFWGAVVLVGALQLTGGQVGYDETIVYYAVLALFLGVVLYSTVLLKVTQSSYFSCVVFLSVAMNHIGDANPYLFVFNRTMDTIIGVGVAILANTAHLPRTRDRETLFVSGIDHVLFREDRAMSPFTKVQLNRFIQDGMRFTVSTKQTPATVRELMAGVGLKLPIIAMDGAVLYDLNTREYLRAVKIDRGLAEEITAFLTSEGFSFFVNTVEENLLVIYSRGLRFDGKRPAPGSTEEAMHALYLKKNTSPYRNYVHSEEDMVDNVVYFLIIDQKERVERLYDALQQQPWAPRVRAAFDTFECREGEVILRIYSCEATRRNMMKELQEILGAPRTVLFGNIPGECDVLIPDAGGGYMAKELKKRFEPVSLAGWRSMIHF